MIKEIDIEDIGVAKQILSIQKDAYRVEAEWIGSYEIPPLKESLEELMGSGERFIGFFEEKRVVGAVSYKMLLHQIDIHRVMVHPDHFRKGIARKMLAYLEQFPCRAKEILVSTGAENKPAVTLYEKSGFQKVGEEVMDNGIRLAYFMKKLNSKEKSFSMD